MLSGILARLGVVRLARYRKVAQDAKTWEVRAKRFSHKLDRARAEVGAWRGKADEAAKALKHSRHEVEREKERFQKFRLQVEKASEEAKSRTAHEAARRVAHDERRSAALHEVKERLVHAERELTVARENLMAVEVKLDILEGAANVLDVRTRNVLTRRGAEAGPSV